MFKVGIIGPESTGKSTLSKYLASRYDGILIPEYAREYMETRVVGRAYAREDVLNIANHQIQQMYELSTNVFSNGCRRDIEKIVFFDTELIITKVWMLHKYGECPKFIEEALRKYPMDVYLLCYPDLEWEPDPVRENPNIREYLFNWYEKEIQALDIPYYIVRHV